MGIGGCFDVGLNVQESGTGVEVATLKRGHSRMSGRLVVRGLSRSRGRDWARRQGGWSRHRVLPPALHIWRGGGVKRPKDKDVIHMHCMT